MHACDIMFHGKVYLGRLGHRATQFPVFEGRVSSLLFGTVHCKTGGLSLISTIGMVDRTAHSVKGWVKLVEVSTQAGDLEN